MDKANSKKVPKSEERMPQDAPAYYGLWLEKKGDPIGWLVDERGWLIHYPAFAIAENHAAQYNNDPYKSSSSPVAKAKPYSTASITAILEKQ